MFSWDGIYLNDTRLSRKMGMTHGSHCGGQRPLCRLIRAAALSTQTVDAGFAITDARRPASSSAR